MSERSCSSVISRGSCSARLCFQKSQNLHLRLQRKVSQISIFSGLTGFPRVQETTFCLMTSSPIAFPSTLHRRQRHHFPGLLHERVHDCGNPAVLPHLFLKMRVHGLLFRTARGESLLHLPAYLAVLEDPPDAACRTGVPEPARL